MGTNYYVRLKCCASCGRYDELHVGKSSFGWQFGFRGYRERDGAPVVIESAAQWREVIGTSSVWDEYGDEHSATDFWKMVESKRGGLSHYRECRGKYGNSYDTLIWLDPEGHPFDASEFS